MVRRQTTRRRRPDTARRFLAVSTCASAALVVGAVALGDDDDEDRAAVVDDAAEPVVETTEPPPADDVTCPDAGSGIEALRECFDPVIVRIDTPIGWGTGMVLSSGEIITAAHVVEPYNTVDVLYTDGRRLRDVEVIGVDLLDDVALIGPTDDRTGLDLATDFDVTDEGSDVFHIGFPGGLAGEQPALSITRGVLSRIRRSTEFDRVLLQSDAVVTGGQSGGAFVDGVGRVIGMSDMAIGANASFSVASTDLADAIDRIRSGTSISAPRLPLAGDGEAGTTSLDVGDSNSTGRVIIPPASTDRDVSLTYDGIGTFAFEASTLDGSLLALNQAWVDDWAGWYSDIGERNSWFTSFEPGAELVDGDDGVYAFTVPAGEYALVVMSRGRAGTLEVDIDVPFVEVADYADGVALEIGDDVDGVLGRLPTATLHEIDLEEGDTIEVRLATPGLLASFDFLTPADRLSDYLYGDFFSPYNVEFGWGDQVSSRSYEILRDGTYRVLVQGESSMAYHLSVTRLDG